jgi:hypothetical protein
VLLRVLRYLGPREGNVGAGVARRGEQVGQAARGGGVVCGRHQVDF